MTNAIVDNTVDLCGSCGLTANHIANGAFQCFTQGAHEVTFRAHLYATPNSSPQELIEHITSWVTHGATIVVDGVLLTVDRHCDIIIASFSEAECSQEQGLTSEPPTEFKLPTTPDFIVAATTSTNKLTTTEQHRTATLEYTTVAGENGSLYLSPVVIVVGAVVVVVILIIAVMLTIIIVACLCMKYCR